VDGDLARSYKLRPFRTIDRGTAGSSAGIGRVREGQCRSQSGISVAQVLKILGSMAQAGLMKRDMLLNALCATKSPTIPAFGWTKCSSLTARWWICSPKRNRIPRGGCVVTSPAEPASFATNNSSLPSSCARFAQKPQPGRTRICRHHGSMNCATSLEDSCRVRVKRSWTAISELAKTPARSLSGLDTLLTRSPQIRPGPRRFVGGILIPGDARRPERDVALRSDLRTLPPHWRGVDVPARAAGDVLQQDWRVFRAAMTIRLQPPGQRREVQSQ